MQSQTTTTIEISKEYLHFGAAHFTIFDANTREDLHGHNFHVTVHATAAIGDDGITFDYNILKNLTKQFCDELDEQVLMPTRSPHLAIDEQPDYTYVVFGEERIPFLARDLTLLPIRNVTVEELAEYLLQKLLNHPEIQSLEIKELHLRCASGVDQWARASWASSPADPG